MDEARVFPIVLDPTVTTSTNAAAIDDTYVASIYPTSNYVYRDYLKTGVDSGGAESGAKNGTKSGTKDRGTSPIGRRNKYNTRKKAEEAARRAGGGKEPIHHPKGCKGSERSHYHPNLSNKFRLTPKGFQMHDHFFY